MTERFITRAEAHDIATAAAEEGSTTAIRRTFAVLGVDIDDFESVQEFRGDLQWVKSGRRISRTVGNKAGMSIIGVVSMGVAVGVFDWVRKIFLGH